MALIIDNRNAIAGPGVHALVVGVSDYKNLRDFNDAPIEPQWFLTKLTSGASSAFAISQLLLRDRCRLPLKTLRLLLSPHAEELAKTPAIGASGASPASRQALEDEAKAWRRDAMNEKDSITVFYFAGHGLQRGPEDGVGLLEDFKPDDGPPLAKSFEVGDIKDGMAPSDTRPNIAMTQFYFMDACLTRPEAQKKFVGVQVPEVFGAELNSVEYRSAPLMFSTVGGAIALGREGQPSYFAEALTLAFDRAAEDPIEDGTGNTVWPVTSLTVKNYLDYYYDKFNLGTRVTLSGIVGNPVLRNLPDPPSVDMSIEVQPEAVGNGYNLWLLDGNDTPTPPCTPAAVKRIDVTIPAGIYRVKVDAGLLKVNPYRSAPKWITQKVAGPWRLDLQPLLNG